MKEIMLSEIYNIPNNQMGTMTLIGIEKALVTDENFSVVMEVDDKHLNTQGSVHGGILFTLCDQAVGAFIVFNNVKGVAMDGNIHYYRPAQKGDRLIAAVYERKKGRTTGVYFVELTNQDGKLIADGLFTAMYTD